MENLNRLLLEVLGAFAGLAVGLAVVGVFLAIFRRLRRKVAPDDRVAPARPGSLSPLSPVPRRREVPSIGAQRAPVSPQGAGPWDAPPLTAALDKASDCALLRQAVAVDEPSPAPAKESGFQDPGSLPPDPFDSPFVFDLSEQFESLFSPDAGIPDSGLVPGAEGADSATETPPEPEVPAEVRETFDSIAAVHLSPVRHFLCLLSAGSVAAEWMENCAPAAGLVARSARSMGLENLAARLESFEELLRRAGVDGVKTVEGAMRELVLRAAEELRQDLPQALSPENVGDQKDSVILHSLLRQIPEVGRVTIDKLFAAGFSSVDALERADAHQLSKSAGIAGHFSERVCDVIQQYGRERDARRAIESPEGWLVPLAHAVAVLEEHHAGLEKPADSDRDRRKAASKRKAHRKGLQLAGLQLNVLLAEMGQIQMVVEIQCLPFEARISRLRAFLSSLARASAT